MHSEDTHDVPIEDEHEPDEQDDDEEYTPERPRGIKRPAMAGMSSMGAVPAPRPRATPEKDGMDGEVKHKERAPRKEPGPETAEDMVRREAHVCQALQANNISEVFRQFSPDACFLVTVYPCKVCRINVAISCYYENHSIGL